MHVHPSHLLDLEGCGSLRDVGFLEERAKEKGYRSLRDLGVNLAPKGEHKEGYIANKVRELDRGENVKWWTETGRIYWDALIEALDVSDDELLKQINAIHQNAQAPNLLPFSMFQGLRALDLSEDKLFPGIPDVFTQPGGPRRGCWWVAPEGAGKTVVGRWLEWRGWSRLEAATWAEAQQRLPSSGRVYLELESAAGAPVEAPASDIVLCVASRDPAPSPPGEVQSFDTHLFGRKPPQQEGPKNRWSVVHTPSANEWLLPLVDWVVARLKNPQGFDPAKIRASAETFQAILITPGDALDLFGVLDEVGVDLESDDNVLRWVKEWLKAAAERADRQVPVGMKEHLKKRGFEVLGRTVTARLRAGLPAELPREAWVELIPEDIRGKIDYLEIHRLAEQNDLTAIRQKLKPDGEAWISTFENIRLLVPRANGWSIRSQWMEKILEAAAVAQLQQEPLGLGVLLVNRETALMGLHILMEEAEYKKYANLEAATANVDLDKPESLALLDGAVRVGGWAVSEQPDFPPELARKLWEQGYHFARTRWDDLPPLPLLGSAAHHEFFSMYTWCLAMLFLSWRGQVARPTALSPWKGGLDAAEKRRFERVTSQVQHLASEVRWEHMYGKGDPEIFVPWALKLGAILLDELGVLKSWNQILGNQYPDVLVVMSQGRNLGLEPQDVIKPNHLIPLREIERRSLARGTDLGSVLSWWFNAAPKNQKLIELLYRPETYDLWRVAPPAVLESHPDLFEKIASTPEVWPLLSDDLWETWLTQWSQKEYLSRPHGHIFTAVPEHLTQKALRNHWLGPYDHDAQAALWARMPEQLFVLVDEWAKLAAPPATVGLGSLADLVAAAHDKHVEGLIERAELWVQEPSAYIGVTQWIWIWLRQIVEKRSPGWRRAFKLLADHYREAP